MLPPLIVFFMAAVVILAGHWFPWRSMLGRKLSRLEAYAFGSMAMVAPAVGALVAMGEAAAAWVIVAGTAGAGLATLGAYGVDKLIAMRHELLDAKDAAAYATHELPLDSAD
jgi:hypothetical protein